MKPYPTPSIMDQAVKLYGCNCDACCNMTPLTKRREAAIKARLTRRTPDVGDSANQNPKKLPSAPIAGNAIHYAIP